MYSNPINVLLSLQWTYRVISWLWTRFSYFDCERSDWRNDNRFRRNSLGTLEIVVVSKHKIFLRTQDVPNKTWTQAVNRCLIGTVLTSTEKKISGMAVFEAGTDTSFSQKSFDDFETGGSAENPILLDDENSPPTALISETPTWPPGLLRGCPFGPRKQNVSHKVYWKLFQ